jgi:hypothetical protein
MFFLLSRCFFHGFCKFDPIYRPSAAVGSLGTNFNMDSTLGLFIAKETVFVSPL